MALPGPAALAAQAGKAEPGVLVLLHRQHQAADAQEGLPHLDVPLHAPQPATPHGSDELASVLHGVRGAALSDVAVLDDFLQLRQLLDPHHVAVGSLIAFTDEGGQLRAKELTGRLDVHLSGVRLSSPDTKHGPKEGASGGVSLPAEATDALDVRVHVIPLPHVPGGVRSHGRHLAADVGLHAAPSFAAQYAEALPLCQGGQAAQLSQGRLQGLHAARHRLRHLLFVGGESVIPALELLVPALLELHLQMLLSVLEHAHSSLRLPQLVVDGDERLDAVMWGCLELQLLVVQRLGKGVALLREGAQCAVVQWQRLLVVLHELSEVEQRCHNLRWDAGARQGRLQAPHQLLLMGLVELGPAGDKSCSKQLTSHGGLHLG
mmetsp:Transcript_32711/g.92784  ORF Transcript_32711/g.92784 Transcript_32711/m.92784 type:complete len:377 (+) Transcript_32711:2905-4035(+)